MTKVRLVFISLIVVGMLLFLDIFVAPSLAARLAVLPVIRSFNILSPQTPIVISKKEVIRASDSTDVVDSINAVKSKIVAIARIDGAVPVVAGSGVLATADGVVVTAGGVVKPVDLAKYMVVTDAGDSVIDRVIEDPATGLSLLVTKLSGVPVVKFAGDASVQVGQRVVAVSHGLVANSPRVSLGLVSRTGNDLSDAVFEADRPVGFLPIFIGGEIVPGSAVIDNSGDIVGLWNGHALVSPSAISSTINVFVASKTEIKRPSFGFSYRMILNTAPWFTTQQLGAQIVGVGAGSSFGTLKPGDVIISFGGASITTHERLENILLEVVPQQEIQLTVMRAGNPLNLKFTPGVLK